MCVMSDADPDQRVFLLLQQAAHRLRLWADRRSVDLGGVTSAQTGVDVQAWDFVQFFTPIGFTWTKNMVMVSRRALEVLPADLQAKIREAAKTAETRGWKASEEAKAASDHQGGLSAPTALAKAAYWERVTGVRASRNAATSTSWTGASSGRPSAEPIANRPPGTGTTAGTCGRSSMPGAV